MAKIIVNNPRQVINGGAKKYYFKVKGLGGPKGDKGDKGDTGATGPQGPQGNAATVSIGSTTTLPVGNDATVTNSGSIYNAVLNFGIPQGPRGPQGATGATGAKGDKGDQGNPGPQGEKGTNATVYIGTTTTGEPGTQASVYNSGTSSNAVLNFTIPRGDVGPSVPLVQETGNSTTKAMSQNATTEALNGKQNTLTAGSNIQISGSTISATDTKYSAGNGITLTGTQFSANTSVLATKNDLGSYYTKTQIDSQMAAKQDDLVAGSNIQIAPDGKTISATDTTYTAGTGLTLTGTEFSADTTVLATQTDLTTALAPKLEAEVVAELPTTGTEGKLYLTPKAHTTSTATGNPIEATITAQAGQLESFQLDGDTFQQSYTGKNLLRLVGVSDSGLTGTVNADGSITITGKATRSGGLRVFTSSQTINSGAYTLTISSALPAVLNMTVATNVGFRLESGATSVTTTLTQEYSSASVFFAATSGQEYDLTVKIQLVAGSTPDYDFEPFVGGQPSPNPEYPQQIQTVTGTQTISINGTNYPISLGSLELCKLGAYQDYIWKDGEDWKVHKATGHSTRDTVFSGLDGNQSVATGTSDGAFALTRSQWSEAGGTDEELFNTLASESIGVYRAQTLNSNMDANAMANGTFCPRAVPNQDRVYFRNALYIGKTSAEVRQKLLSTYGGFSLWYYKNTPTDTVITDTTLIAQLEAIRTASLENGTNTITNTATGTNLAGNMEIGYFGLNPTNRYDKFIWLNLNNNYEQIGGE